MDMLGFDLSDEELFALARANREVIFRNDSAVFEKDTLPPALTRAHPEISSIALSCDPILANVLVSSDDGITGLEYDAERDVLSLKYERTALAAEAIGGLLEDTMVSTARIYGWVRLSLAEEPPVIVSESDTESDVSMPSGDVSIIGKNAGILGSVSEGGAAVALKKLIISSCVVSIQEDADVHTLLRRDACATDDKLLQARYAMKHVILDYGGFRDADIEEPGIVEDVFSDRRMWLWSFTSTDEHAWGGSILMPRASQDVFEG